MHQGRCAWCGIWLKAELKSENKRGIPDQAYRARFAGASAIAPQLERNRESCDRPSRSWIGIKIALYDKEDVLRVNNGSVGYDHIAF